MSRFAIRLPYLIIVICLITCVVGVTSLVRMPVDLFPPIKIPVVVVATFFNGMPPEQIETDITGRFERFFTLASGVDHIESRSLPGVSLIKIYFQPGFNPDSAVTSIANLAMADLRKLPPGTLPPVVLQFDASSLPVCLITLKGEGLNEAKLRDLGQYDVRNQVANVPGASVPQPFGGRYRQIMVYVDPLKLESHQLSVMDVVRTVNNANLILPAGDVKIGPYDYNLYVNSQINDLKDINQVPLKTIGNASVLVGDVGHAVDGSQIQYNVVRVDGQPSVYLPVLKQGGDANTIAVVDGIKEAVAHLIDVPKQLVTKVVFDQSVFVRNAIENLIHEGLIGLVLTGVMILVFLGSMRATVAVFLSIPLSALAAFIALSLGGSTINAMILGGLALAFSRLIDNSVVVLENIFRHIEMGEPPEVAAERGGQEVALPVLAATLTTAIVFFPVIFLYGVSQFLFTALALSVILSLFASYFVAMTVVPLFCAKFIKAHHGHVAGEIEIKKGRGRRFNALVQPQISSMARSLRRLAEPGIAAAAGHGAGHHGHFCFEPRAVSADRRGLLSAHRSGPVRHQCQGADRHAHRTHRPTGAAGGTNCPRRRAGEGFENHRFKHRRHARFFVNLHAQFRAAHGLCAGGAECRSSFEQLSIHGPGARAAEKGVAASHRLFPNRRTGGRDSEPRDARAAGHSSQRQGPGRHAPDCGGNRPKSFARCRMSAMCWCRRTWIIRRCNWTLTACAPPNLA